MRLTFPEWKLLIKIIGPLLFIFVLIKVVDAPRVLELIRNSNPYYLLISLGFFPLIIGIKTLRWMVICRHFDITLSYRGLYQINYVSWFLGSIPPGGLGVLAKIAYMKEDSQPVGQTLITLTLDKIFDVMGHLCFGMVGFVFLPLAFFKGAYVYLLVAVVLIFFMIPLFLNKILDFLIWLARILFKDRYKNKLSELKTNLILFWSYSNRRSFFAIISLSLIINILRALVLYLLALSLMIPITFGMIFGARALIGMANIIPITINGLGTRDAILIMIFSLTGLAPESALALGLFAFLWACAFTFSGVLFFLWRPLPRETMASFRNNLPLLKKKSIPENQP